MSTARNPLPPAKPSREEAVRILRDHLGDDDAEMLADRYLNADQMQGHRSDIAVMKRLLKQKLEH